MSTDFVEIQPWPVIELAGSLVARAALFRRAAIEANVDAEMYERETDRFELDAWARLELTGWLKPFDLTTLESPVDSMSDDQLERGDHAAIQASTIAWALNVVKTSTLPLFSDGAPEDQALEWSPGPWTPVRNVISGLRVRSDEALAQERERWELVYWRLTLPHPLDEDSTLALGETVSEIAASDLLAVSNGDIVADDGTRFGDLDGDLVQDYLLEAETRLRTLNWICGLSDDMDTAPLFPDG